MANRKERLMAIQLEKCIQIYLSTLETEGKSPRYLDWLRTRLQYFTAFVHKVHGEGFSLRDLAVEDGREFIRELMNREVKYSTHPLSQPRSGKLSIHYINGIGRAIRSFSNWACEEGYLEEHVMHRLKLPPLPKTQPEPLTEEEIRKVLTMCLDHTLESYRNFAMMMLFLDTGLRLSEVIHLRLSRVDFALGEMTVLGKGNKERKVPFGSQAKKALIDYLTRVRPETENKLNSDRVFLNSQGHPITQEVVEKVFQRVRAAAGVPHLHPHVCRHTFAVRYLINGGDVFSLQKILGHSSLEMTRRYVNLAFGDVKEKHRQFSPMDNLNFRSKTRGHPKLQSPNKPRPMEWDLSA
jgi:site-specific recombinase XerD